MKRKAVWLILSCLIVAALVLASCGPAAVEEEEGKTVVGKVVEKEAPVEEEEEEEVVTPKPTGPQYGGVYTFGVTADVLGFDESSTNPYQTYSMNLTNESLLVGDWARGPTGTGEASWTVPGINILDLTRGRVAESWEVPDNETIIFHIRKGIHFHNKPPTSGRELVADDVVYSLKRQFETPGAYCYKTYPGDAAPSSITAPDKWTVELKVPPGNLGAILIVTSDYIGIYPRDMGEKWGDFVDWRSSCGSGPFMMTDYVPDSSITFERNPDYWDTDPLHPENKLPYLDVVKRLTIPDWSTRLSALRTGKIDTLHGVRWDDAEIMMETNPELPYYKSLPVTTYSLHMRVDKGLPFDDVRVRQALWLAIDNEKIRDVHYGGNAEMLTFPIVPVAEFMDMYTPLEELPENVRELYEYHPDKAKQLLAEAGYPDGFKTEIVCYAFPTQVDLLSLIKAMWAEVGVDLEIQGKEVAVWQYTVFAKQHPQMAYFYDGTSAPFKMNNWKAGNPNNASIVRDQFLVDKYAELCTYYPLDEPKARDLLKELTPYILEQAWVITPPWPYVYCFWQPWVKGYSGEYSVGYYESENWPIWIWLDQDIKKERTGR